MFLFEAVMNSMLQCHKTDPIILAHYSIMLTYLKFPRRRPICIMFFVLIVCFCWFFIIFSFHFKYFNKKISYKNNSKNYFYNRKKIAVTTEKHRHKHTKSQTENQISIPSPTQIFQVIPLLFGTCQFFVNH